MVGAEPRTADADQPRRATERRTWEERRRPGRAHYLGIERRRSADRRVTGERRLYLIQGQQAEIARLHESLVAKRPRPGLGGGARGGGGAGPADAAASRSGSGAPSGSRSGAPFPAARSRRWWTWPSGMRRPASASAEVLRWIGLDAAEVDLDRLVQGEAVGVRAFYYDVLGGMPGVYPLVTPMLGEPLAARGPARGRPARPARAAGRAIGGAGAAVDPPRRERAGRRRCGPSARSTTARPPSRSGRRCTIPIPGPARPPPRRSRSGAAAPWRCSLAAALETSATATPGRRCVTALGRIGTVETCDARWPASPSRAGACSGARATPPASVSRPSRPWGSPTSPAARTTLERLARDAEGVVRYAADRVLEAERQRGRLSAQRCTSNPSMCRSRL